MLATDYDSSPPDAPLTGVVLFARLRAGRRRPAFVGPSGLDTGLQSLLASNKVRWWSAQGSGSTVALFNLTTQIAGTATTRAIDPTTFLGAVGRIGYVGALAINTGVGIRHNLQQFFRGGGIYAPGGFEVIHRWGIPSFVSGNRAFAGLCLNGSAIAGTAVPANFINCIGIGYDSGDTLWHFYHNDAAGAATKVSTGLEIVSGQFLETRIFAAPNGGSVWMSIEILNTGALAQYEASSNLPAANYLMGEQIWVSSGTDATVAISVDVASRYIETDY